MIRKALGLMILGGGIALVACSDDGPTGKYPSTDAFCAAVAAEECKEAGGICGVTADACKARRTDACKARSSQALAQGRTFNSAKGEICVAKTTEVYATRVIDPVKEEAFIDACERAFVGAKKASEACTNVYECEGALICDLTKGSRCAPEVEKKKDEFCSNPGETCVESLYCQDSGGAKACKDRKKVGENCDPANPCLEDLRCAVRCVPKQAAGQPCDTNAECTTDRCDTTSTPRKCVARQYPTESGTCKDFGGAG